MRYRIGNLILQTNISLPDSYKPFQVTATPDQMPEDAPLVLLDETSASPDYSRLTKCASHRLMTVWKAPDGWLFEKLGNPEEPDSITMGTMMVSADYRHGTFYSDVEDEPYRILILQSLLQALLECRLIYTGTGILHAACVKIDGQAIAFSGPSGVGKSTRANMWVEELGAVWISGDRPSIDPAQGTAHGAPWDGKEHIFTNKAAPIKAILEIYRGNATCVCRMSDRQKMRFLASQLMIPMWDTGLTQKAFAEMNQMIRHVPIYRLYSGIGEGAAQEAYDILFKYPERILSERGDESMRLKENFEITDVAGDYMAVPTGDNMATFGGTVVLNEISAFLLKAMRTPVTEEELLDQMTAEYDVERETAAADLKEILAVLEEIGLIER